MEEARSQEEYMQEHEMSQDSDSEVQQAHPQVNEGTAVSSDDDQESESSSCSTRTH